MNETAIAFVIAAMLTASPAARAEMVQYPQFSPQIGVVCDAVIKGCASGSYGVSSRLTARYFDADAAEAVHDGRASWGFSNGVKCSSLIRSCYGGADKSRKAIQSALFGG